MILLSGAVTSAANAADIQIGTRNGPCAVSIAGSIEQGDFESFFAAAQSAGLLAPSLSGEPANTPQEAVCLDSVGGSFLEGLSIAELVLEVGMATRIEKSSVCYSACSFIFMAGRLVGPEGGELSRTLVRGGRLGFHAPYASVPPGKYSGAQVEAAANNAFLSMARFLEYAFETSRHVGNSTIPAGLILTMMRTPPDELVMLSTLEDAVLWQVSIEGGDGSRPLDDGGARSQACVNAYYWETGHRSYEAERVVGFPRAPVPGPNSAFADIISMGGDYVEDCAIVEHPSRNGYLYCVLTDLPAPRSDRCDRYNSSWHYIPEYYALPPGSPIY